MNKTLITSLLYIVAVIFVVIGIIYITVPANHLPTLLPGYSDTLTKKHYTHGLAAIVLAVLCVIAARFQRGRGSAS